jgi:hypothetical protein
MSKEIEDFVDENVRYFGDTTKQVLIDKIKAIHPAPPSEPTQKELFAALKSAWENYPSQDNEGYQPNRGGFNAGWFAYHYWLLKRNGGE